MSNGSNTGPVDERCGNLLVNVGKGNQMVSMLILNKFDFMDKQTLARLESVVTAKN